MTALFAIIVHVKLSVDASIRSSIVNGTAKSEAAAIWRGYDVQLKFDDEDGDARVCIAAFVNRTPHAADGGDRVVLGSTFVLRAPDGAPAPVRIAFDRIDDLAKPSASANPIIHEYAVGTAIGRVLAHEIGHILLGAPGYHDAHGLMRGNFQANDFLPWNRSRYHLEDVSVTRLRDRLSTLSAADAAPRCIAR